VRPADETQWRQACQELPEQTFRQSCLLSEWAYGMSFQSSSERNRWRGRHLAIYNRRRCHMALAGRTPYQQLNLLRATEQPSEKTHLVKSIDQFFKA